MSERTNIPTVACVVVTYNRLSLLKESISALKKQTYPISKIVIVDNHSTDGTADFLAAFNENDQIKILRMSSNIGGAGGFNEGVKWATSSGYDWIWLMDDDTIPENDALEQLMKLRVLNGVGFICSKVVWTDGSVHLMNIPEDCTDASVSEHLFSGHDDLKNEAKAVIRASFVSLLIRGTLPKAIGLPYKEFFIWCDDAEYTERIINYGYHGVMSDKSIVLHKTPTNHLSSLKKVSASDAWKLYYGERNDSFLRRKRTNLLVFLFSQLNAFRLHAHWIRSRNLPKEEEKVLLKASWKGLWDGFTFNPDIEYV